MGQDEKRIAIYLKHPFREWIEKGYPLLQKEAENLTAAGVQFHDLTMLFSKTSEPIYRDNCCHYNQSGNDILAATIAKEIIANWKP